ncbi:MAG: hypothetical protein NDJ90_14825 [Oligoflexia bacterium]|nr:hypothetical protein [Oligoflexia bacterium]
MTVQQDQLDPLFVIFEQHLYNFQDSDTDRKTFIGNIVLEYFSYLRKKNIVIPKSLEGLVFEELAGQVGTMLVKKIYGCLTIEDYRKAVPEPLKKKARGRYARLSKNRPSRQAA